MNPQQQELTSYQTDAQVEVQFMWLHDWARKLLRPGEHWGYLGLDIYEAAMMMEITGCQQNSHCHSRNCCCSRLGIAPLATTLNR